MDNSRLYLQKGINAVWVTWQIYFALILNGLGRKHLTECIAQAQRRFRVILYEEGIGGGIRV